MQMLKENTGTSAIRQDCADIRNWMDLLGNYNKALVVNQNARGQGLLGAAS